MAIRVTCISKSSGDHDNPNEAISYLEWVEDGTGNVGRWARIKMYNWIREGGVAYVIGSLGHKVYVTTRTSKNNNPYVVTVADSRETNNLLSLPEC